MMVNLPILLFTGLFFLLNAPTSDLEGVRTNYSKLVADKSLCERMLDELSQTQEQSATHRAYLGGVQSIWANHVFNPISKLQTFKEGKRNIERAIQMDPDNVEIRYIRLSVQKNAPSFLGYRANVMEDTEFIHKNRHQIKSEILQKNMDTLIML